MNSIIPCIWFDDQAEKAAAFYVRVFARGRVVATSYYPESGANPSGRPPGGVLTVEFEVAGQRFTALNGGPVFTVNPSISFFVNVETPTEAERLFASLAEGGDVLMPIAAYPWSERYGWVKDRFGVSWQVMAVRVDKGATIVPCFMFAGANEGRAEEAVRAYVGIFPDSRIESLERYAAGEGPVGSVKHGRFVACGQPMVAMDSHVSPNVMFNEALSFQVMCEDQADVDRYWEKLGEAGATGVCGWLKDRFGVSWQVVPKNIATWMASKDATARDRAFAAILKMKKLDVGILERAFASR